MIKFKFNDSRKNQVDLDDLDYQIEKIQDQLGYYDQFHDLSVKEEQEYNKLTRELEALESKRDRLKSRKKTRDAVIIKKEVTQQTQNPITFKFDDGYKVEVIDDGNQSKTTLYKEAAKAVDFIKKTKKDR